MEHLEARSPQTEEAAEISQEKAADEPHENEAMICFSKKGVKKVKSGFSMGKQGLTKNGYTQNHFSLLCYHALQQFGNF